MTAGQADGGRRRPLRMARRESSPGYRLARNEWLANVVASERFDIPGSFHAGAQARRMIGERFGEVLSAEERERLRALVSELVNNAVLHGGADSEHHVIVHLAVAPECLRAEICDGGPGLDPDDLRERERGKGGRGFVILDALASRWGVSTDDGTCVWFEIDRGQRPR